MRKNSPRTKRMEPTAPKVLSRYLSAPSVSCHDHCKCATKEPITETKPINSFPRRIPKAPPDRTKLEASNSVNKIKKAPSVIPKVTTRNVKNNNVVKDPNSKRDVLPLSTKKAVAIEPKTRDSKPKSENSQAKKNNIPNSRTSTRRHSDIFLPNADKPLPSPRVPKRRLSEIGIRPMKDVSVSNTSLVRGSRISKNEPRKDSKLATVTKKSNTIIKPTVPSPKRGARVSTLRSYKSLPQSELKSSRKSKPKKPIDEVVPETTLHVVEPINVVETTETESRITPDSPSSSEEKVMTHDHNGLQECSPPTEDDTTATCSKQDDNVSDSEAIDTKEATMVGKLAVETTDCSTKTESHITPDSSPSSEVEVMTHGDNGLQEYSLSIEDDTTATDDQYNESVEDSEVVDTKETTQDEKLVVESIDCCLDDLVFRRGKVHSPHSEGSSPRKVQFMQGKELDENETEKGEKIILRRMSYDGVIHVPESQSVSVELKHQEVAEKESPELFNKVIEETASKLIETRKSKVKALVGAFENIVSAATQTPY